MSAPTWSPPEPDSDPRFTLGLTLDVGKVLAKHGYPDLTDPASASDFVELQLALFHFIRQQGEREARTEEESVWKCIWCPDLTFATHREQQEHVRTVHGARAIVAKAEGRCSEVPLRECDGCGDRGRHALGFEHVIDTGPGGALSGRMLCGTYRDIPSEGRSQRCPGCVADENGGEAAHTCALNQPEGRS